jgi:hypothetical protein
MHFDREAGVNGADARQVHSRAIASDMVKHAAEIVEVQCGHSGSLADGTVCVDGFAAHA